MNRTLLMAIVVLVLAGFLLLSQKAAAQVSLSDGYAKTVESLDAKLAKAPDPKPSARAGSEIWFNATAFNDRFFTYSFQQRLGGAIDWFWVLGAKYKADIFQRWGGIPDPDCCIPGEPGCPAKSLDETYGFQWCPGDNQLLQFIGKTGYKDPACDLKDSSSAVANQAQNACDLHFGTSTGVLGLRKFPNPRFNAEKWIALNGSLGSWDCFRGKGDAEGKCNGKPAAKHFFDGSIEPPFRIGMACGACHIGYKPDNPPADPNKPEWENIDGLVGNQYSRISNLLGSGFTPHDLEWQLIARARPGIVDTSALPMDFVSNPGTMNAIINFARRPLHEHTILKWRKVAQCEANADIDSCWCEPGRQGKCWQRGTQKELVQNILKGGEDSIGLREAIQRVYFNIGSCSEQCWINHLPDVRAADPRQRNYGQSPFNVGQCRLDCAAFRAIEDRLPDLEAFFMTARPSDLWTARGITREQLEAQLDQQFFPGAVKRGRDIFAKQCASCHSSQPEPHGTADFHATDPNDPTLRLDWLGNDEVQPASEIGTFAGRALHSNHMPSRVWEEYAALDLRERPADPARKEVMKGGGRGYYRNVSLLSTWAHAPFMHNNAVGPEICGQSTVNEPGDLDFNENLYVTKEGAPLESAPKCRPFDPSVEGRYRLYVDSMRDMLNPSKRIPKMHLLSADVIIPIVPKIEDSKLAQKFGISLSIKFPKGKPALDISSLRFKEVIQDLVLVLRGERKFTAKYQGLLDQGQRDELQEGLRRVHAEMLKAAGNEYFELDDEARAFIQKFYSNTLERVENNGHRFGESLSDQDKDALIAFVATL
jgi:hypothetical protein